MNKKTQDFFNTNPKIRNIAFLARDELRSSKYFPTSSIYFIHDYDIDIKKELVWIVINSPFTYEESYQRLDEFDNWWLPICKKAEGKLGISVKAKEYY